MDVPQYHSTTVDHQVRFPVYTVVRLISPIIEYGESHPQQLSISGHIDDRSILLRRRLLLAFDGRREDTGDRPFVEMVGLEGDGSHWR